MKHTSSARRIALLGLVMALAVMVAALAGCAEKATMDESDSETQMGEDAMGDDAMAEMTCPMCNVGAPAVEAGTATEEDGVQVVRVTLKDGYYSPNEITIKSGMPAKIIFTGDAKDCSGKPKIAALNKQVDFTASGEATMDLGMVNPGTYEITCGMDSAGGHLIVE